MLPASFVSSGISLLGGAVEQETRRVPIRFSIPIGEHSCSSCPCWASSRCCPRFLFLPTTGLPPLRRHQRNRDCVWARRARVVLLGPPARTLHEQGMVALRLNSRSHDLRPQPSRARSMLTSSAKHTAAKLHDPGSRSVPLACRGRFGLPSWRKRARISPSELFQQRRSPDFDKTSGSPAGSKSFQETATS